MNHTATNKSTASAATSKPLMVVAPRPAALTGTGVAVAGASVGGSGVASLGGERRRHRDSAVAKSQILLRSGENGDGPLVGRSGFVPIRISLGRILVTRASDAKSMPSRPEFVWLHRRALILSRVMRSLGTAAHRRRANLSVLVLKDDPRSAPVQLSRARAQ
jgi:hypothetical protein